MRRILSAAMILAGLAGCVPSEKVTGSGGELMQVRQGNVGAFHGLRLGVANIFTADYVDETGAKKRGLTAALTLFIDGDPPQEKDFNVRAGQKIVLGSYSAYVEEIRGTVGGRVTLRLERL